MPDVQTEVTTMNAQWYNYLTDAMGLDQSTFMLAQGCLGLQSSDSSGLFLMSDAVPPSASVAYFDPAGLSKRSDAYGLLLQALLPESGQTLAQILGDKYTGWLSFLKTYQEANPDASYSDTFNAYADKKLAPGLAASAKSAFLKAQHTPLNEAITQLYASDATTTFTDSSGSNYKLETYSASIGDAKSAINTGASVNIDFSSASESSTLKHTTVEGSASGFYDIFSGSASASFDKLNTTASSSAFSIKGKIGKYATLTTNPINWFNSAEFMRAYNAQNNNNVWDAQATSAGDWSSFFGQSGSLARRITQLFLVSDYSIEVTSHASYSQSDFQEIKTEASFGVWPFFSGSASSTNTTSYKLNEDASLTVIHTLNPGLIQIWGATVQDAPN